MLARRFGDCKDKTLLLCKLLSAVGIEAFPVLVSSVYRSETVRFLPAPDVFNHVIVAFQLEGELVWIDPTATCQGGRLQQRHLPRYVCGLVVHPGTESLCEIPEQGLPSSSHLVERFELSRTPSRLVNLSICHTFTGVEADGLRSELNTFGATEVKDAFKEMMLKRFPDAKRIDTIEISDDLESNTIKINDSYRMAAEQFPQSGGGQYHFPIHLITDNIPTTEEARLYPLALRFPRDVIHEISVDVPYAFDSPQSGEKVSSGPGFEFEHLTESRSGGIIFRCRYRTT